jgi:hypothetical protein
MAIRARLCDTPPGSPCNDAAMYHCYKQCQAGLQQCSQGGRAAAGSESATCARRPRLLLTCARCFAPAPPAVALMLVDMERSYITAGFFRYTMDRRNRKALAPPRGADKPPPTRITTLKNKFLRKKEEEPEDDDDSSVSYAPAGRHNTGAPPLPRGWQHHVRPDGVCWMRHLPP